MSARVGDHTWVPSRDQGPGDVLAGNRLAACAACTLGPGSMNWLIGIWLGYLHEVSAKVIAVAQCDA
jgi:hypothetical protein